MKLLFKKRIIVYVFLFAIVLSLPISVYLVQKQSFEKSEAAANVPPAGSPVAINGQLHVCGTNLCNQCNQPIQLRGVDAGLLQHYPACIAGVKPSNCQRYLPNESALDAIAYEWQADLLRISVSPQSNAYETCPDDWDFITDKLVDEAYERGMYALIDWHVLHRGDPFYNTDPNNPNNPHREAAVTGFAERFFEHMTQMHANKEHVIYEIANEPNGVSWSRIKEYAQYMIPLIRKNDPDAVIIVGTYDYSTAPSKVLESPLTGTLAQNVMYAIHFYGNFGPTRSFNQITSCDGKIPLFATEWGAIDAGCQNPPYTDHSQTWVDTLKERKISWVSWVFVGSYYDTCNQLKPEACPNGPWTGSGLREWGQLAYEWTKYPVDDFPSCNGPTPTSTSLQGDINQDGKVNILDYSILFENFGQQPPDDPRADINQDGKVNILDYSILFENFGKTA